MILARGLGSRMRREDGAALDPAQASVADTGVKAMIPIGRPFLDYVLSGLADAGCDAVCLVIGPEHGVVRDYYRGRRAPRGGSPSPSRSSRSRSARRTRSSPPRRSPAETTSSS